MGSSNNYCDSGRQKDNYNKSNDKNNDCYNNSNSKNSNENNNYYNNSNNNNSYENNDNSNNNNFNEINKEPEEKQESNIEKGRAYGAEAGINLCGLYCEKTSHGDYNVGVSYNKSMNKGNFSVSSGSYAEITYNKDDGFTYGAGVSVDNSRSISKNVKIKGVKVEAGVYESDYVSEDKVRKNLCCNK